MATLQKIRTKAGLLVAIVIGLSLAAFILGDMLQSGSSIFRKNQMEIGEIDGQTIQYPDFQKQVEELAEIYRMNSQQSQLDENTWVQVREQAWQDLVRSIVMSDVYDDLGISISKEELFDMLSGTNLHPIVEQLFRNQETGQVDRGAIIRFLKNLETGVAPEQRDYWLYLEKEIVKSRRESKYSNMVAKGLYVTNEEAQSSLTSKNKSVNFDYINLSFSSVADSQVVVSDKDLKDYFAKHKDEYKQEKLRRIEYIAYPVKPSTADFQEAEHWINDIKADFETADDNIQFVNSNSDVSFEPVWYKKETLPENLAAWIYDENAEVNAVFGPYFENDTYKLSKLHAIEMMPDSVEARHILLRVNTQQELMAMQMLADSLKTAIENGSDFASLARTNSSDGTAAIGGDLGWFSRGQMVAPFEEAAFGLKENEVTVVGTQFGLHVIQVTKRGGLTRQVQVANLVRNVVPSTRTYQDTYAQASKFAGENSTVEEFNAAVSEQKLTKRVASIRENDREIVGLENARTLIRAAYDAEEGEIIISQQESPIFELGDNFVIATLIEATEEGVSTFEDVKERVKLSVIKEKKAEKLAEQAKTAMQGKTDLESIATALSAKVQNTTSVNFNSFQVPGVGLEPAVIGTATSLEVDKISAPVTGNNGVFIVKVTAINEGNDQDLAAEKIRLAQNHLYRASAQALETHRDAVEIVDKRSKFY